MNFAGANGAVKTVWRKLMFSQILVAMDTSTVGVLMNTCLGKATGSSLMLLHVLSLKKAVESAYIFQPGILFRAGGKNLEIHQEQWKTFV